MQTLRGKVNGDPILTDEIGSQKASKALRELAAFWRWEEEDSEQRLHKRLIDALAEMNPELKARLGVPAINKVTI